MEKVQCGGRLRVVASNSNANEEDIVTMLKELNAKFDLLVRLLTGKWKDDAARQRERCW